MIVHAPSKIKGHGRELQLPSMQQLTSKSSSQHFLLRILKVVIQLRDAARAAARKANKAGEHFITHCLCVTYRIFTHVACRDIGFVSNKNVRCGQCRGVGNLDRKNSTEMEFLVFVYYYSHVA